MENLFQSLNTRAFKYPDQTALVSGTGDGYVTLSNDQLIQNIACVEAYLKQQDVQCIGIYMDNCADWIICDLAAAKLGITLVPIPLFFSTEQITHLITSAQVEAIVTQPAMAKSLVAIHQLSIKPAAITLPLECSVFVRLPTIKSFLSNSLLNSPLAQEVAKITFTSGSTGDPKGVCLSSNNIEAVCQGVKASTTNVGAVNHLCVMPLATLLENIAGVYVCLMRGGIVITEPLATLGFVSNVAFDIDKLIAKIHQHQVGSIILFPQILNYLIEAIEEKPLSTCSSLQFIALGGGKTSEYMLHRAEKLGLPVYEGYGLSECGSVVSLNLPQQSKLGSVGKPLPHVSVTLAEDGEIIVSGQSMLGYLGELDNPPQKTYTGDLGYIDADGYIYVSGRKKNVLVSSYGRNISPEWVEARLVSFSAISQAAVFGEARSSLAAVIVTNKIDELDVKHAIEQCNQGLPDYARIRHWVITQHVFTPENNTLTTNGRLKRTSIETMYQESLNAIYA